MIRNDEAWQSIVKSPSRTIKTAVGSFDMDEEITNVSITLNGFSGDNIGFGEICSNQLSVDLYVTDDANKPYKAQELSVTQYMNDESVSLGKYWVDEVKNNDNSYVYEVTAYDCLYDIVNGKVTLAIANSNDGGDILKIVNDYLEDKYETQFSLTDIEKARAFPSGLIPSGNYDANEILPKILQYIGYNIRCGSDGNPTLYWWTTQNYTVEYEDQMMDGFTRNLDEAVCVDKIRVKIGTDEETGEETYIEVSRSETPTGDYAHIYLQFENSYLTQEALNNLQDRLTPLIYYPCEVEYRGNPAIEVGDAVSVETYDGSTVQALISTHTLDLTGLSGTIECKGDEGETSSGSSVSAKVEALSNELHMDYMNAQEIKSNYAQITLANVVAENVNALVARQLLARSLFSESAIIDSIKSNLLVVADNDMITGGDGNEYDKYRKVSRGSNDFYQEARATEDGVTYDNRIVIGRVTSEDDYNIVIYGQYNEETGICPELFNSTGVTPSGIMNADVVNAINNDGKTTTITASRINVASIIEEINNDEKVINASSIVYNGSSLSSIFTKYDNFTTTQSTLNQTYDGYEGSISRIEQGLNNSTDADNQKYTLLKAMMNFKATYDKLDVEFLKRFFSFNDDGLIIKDTNATSETAVNLIVSNDGISFFSGDNPAQNIIATFTSEQLKIMKGWFFETLTIGRDEDNATQFSFIPETNGNLSLKLTQASTDE